MTGWIELIGHVKPEQCIVMELLTLSGLCVLLDLIIWELIIPIGRGSIICGNVYQWTAYNICDEAIEHMGFLIKMGCMFDIGVSEFHANPSCLIKVMISFWLPLQSGVTISKLTEERRLSNQETKILQEKLVSLRATA